MSPFFSSKSPVKLYSGVLSGPVCCVYCHRRAFNLLFMSNASFCFWSSVPPDKALHTHPQWELQDKTRHFSQLLQSFGGGQEKRRTRLHLSSSHRKHLSSEQQALQAFHMQTSKQRGLLMQMYIALTLEWSMKINRYIFFDMGNLTVTDGYDGIF